MPLKHAMRRDATRLALMAGLSLLLMVACASGASAATTPFVWSEPGLVDHVPSSAKATGLTGMSCPSASLCVAVDDSGSVVTSTNPTGGASAWSTPVVVDGSHKLTGISCPSATFCAAVDDAGNVVTSTDPAGGASAWSAPALIGEQVGYLAGISCPSSGLCVATGGYDTTGSIITSTNPTGGASAWTTTLIGGQPSGVTCASAALCLVKDESGFDVSTNPTGGFNAWAIEEVGATGWSAPSCPSTSLCVAISRTGGISNAGGSVITTTEPTTPGAWSAPVEIDAGAALQSVTCPSAALCVAVNEHGELLTSTNPTGGASAWSAPVKLDTRGTQPFEAQMIYSVNVACGSTSLCVAYDTRGTVMTSTNPAGGESAWGTATQVDGANALFAVSCSSTSLCVAAAEDGGIVTSTEPSADAWNKPVPVDSGNAIRSISCPAATLCVAGDDQGNIVTTTTPTGAASAWKVAHVDSAAGGFSSQAAIVGISCPSQSLCVAVDDGGNVLTSTNPTGGPGAWSAPTYIDNPYGQLGGVACPSSGLCVAFDYQGDLLTSTNPAGGASAWSVPIKVGGSNFYTQGITAVSCASVTFCVAISRSGEIISSTNPTSGASGWSAPVSLETSLGEYGPEGVSCPTTSFCGAIDGSGNAFVSAEPRGEASAWSATSEADPRQVDAEIPFAHAISCPSASLCVAVDDRGDAVVGKPEVNGTGSGEEEPPHEVTEPPAGTSKTTTTTTTTTSTTSSAATTATTSTTESSSSVTAQQVKAALNGLLSAGQHAKLDALLKRGTLPFTAPEAGTVTVRWYVIEHGGKRAKKADHAGHSARVAKRKRHRHASKDKARRVLIASGTSTVSGAGSANVKLALTRIGKRLLKHDRLDVSVVVKFKPKGGPAISLNRRMVK